MKNNKNLSIANRISNLGTETAFAVSGDAASWASQGNQVYPFHLGDMNINTPKNIVESAYRAMRDGKTGYCPAGGIVELREALAEVVGKERNISFSANNVSVQPGGKPCIGKFLTTVMEPGDGVLYPNPGYPIYESQVDFLGGKGCPYTYKLKNNRFEIDRESIERYLTQNIRILILNAQHNPTGADCSIAELSWLANIAREYNLWILSDDPYYDIRYADKSHSILEFDGMQERTVIGYTFSKKYAMTGWRLGAAIGPKPVIDVITKINTNDESCTSHFTQYAGVEALKGDQTGTVQILSILKKRRDLIVDKLNEISGVEVPNSDATFYLFADVTQVFNRFGLKAQNESDIQKFRIDTMHQTGVSFCSRSHFGRAFDNESKIFARFAYSGIETEPAEEGLSLLKKYWEQK